MIFSKLAGLALLFGIAPATMAANLVANPDFDSGLTGWTADPGTAFSLDTLQGRPAPSALVGSTVSGPGRIRSMCIQIDASQNVDFSARGHCNGPATIDFNLNAYSDAGCTTAISTAAHLAMGDQLCMEDWVGRDLTNFSLPAATQSVQVEVFSPSTFPQNVDAIRFGPTGTAPIVLQSFEVH